MVEVGKKYKQVKYLKNDPPECIIVMVEKFNGSRLYNIHHRHTGYNYDANTGALSEKEIDEWFIPIEPKKIREYRIVDFCRRTGLNV